jgi:hypothetical protein
MDVHVRNNHVIITTTNSFGTATRIIDVSDLEDFMRSHPQVVAAANASLNQMLAELHMKTTDLVTLSPLAVGCGAQAQALAAATGAMTTACTQGTANQCASATYNYIVARDNYNACMSQGAPGG